MKSFLFFNPVDRYFDIEITNYNHTHRQESIDTVGNRYRDKLAQCIRQRYLRNGFSIHYALLNDDHISSKMAVPPDKIMRSSMNSLAQIALEQEGEEYHMDNKELLSQLGPTDEIMVSGFHSDCVDYFAEFAYNSGIKTMVDDDLLENFLYWSRQPGFRTDIFPSVKLPEEQLVMIRMGRAGKPWLWQH